MNLDPAAPATTPATTPATAPAAKPAAKPDPRASSLPPPLLPLLVRHVLRALALFASCRVWYAYTVDAPKPIYHCPLDLDGLMHRWHDENCHWSGSYAEAREKFVALGNHLEERQRQRRRRRREGEGGGRGEIVDVRSLSYDVADRPGGGDYAEYLASLLPPSRSDGGDPGGGTMPHGATAAVRPGRDTVDAIVLTLRIPDDDIDDGDDGGGGRGGGRKRRRRRNVNVIHSSGTHGVEGYLGSAVQVRFLHELLLRSGTDDAVDDRRSPSASSPYSSSTCFTRGNVRKVLLIHSVNPYGMRHHRRTNENNVDLNRNVLGGPASFAELRSRHPNECHYVDMDAALNPADRGDVGGGIVPPFSWADAALGGGYAGDVSGLRRHDEEMMVRRRRDPSTGGGDPRIPRAGGDPLDDAPTTYSSAMKAHMEENGRIFRVIASMVRHILVLGYTNAKRGLVTGQYHKQSGLSYGGGAHNSNGWENSVLAVRHAIAELAGLRFDDDADPSDDDDDDDDGGGRAIWVDVHTGLGGYGRYSVLTKSNDDEERSGAGGGDERPRPAWMTEFASLLEGAGMGYGRSADPGVSSGYDATRGFLNGDVLCPPPRCAGVTQEFGTRPGMGVAVALILENAGYHHSGDAGGGRRAHADYLTWAFYPQRLSWRRMTLRGGIDMLHAILNF